MVEDVGVTWSMKLRIKGMRGGFLSFKFEFWRSFCRRGAPVSGWNGIWMVFFGYPDFEGGFLGSPTPPTWTPTLNVQWFPYPPPIHPSFPTWQNPSSTCLLLLNPTNLIPTLNSTIANEVFGICKLNLVHFILSACSMNTFNVVLNWITQVHILLMFGIFDRLQIPSIDHWKLSVTLYLLSYPSVMSIPHHVYQPLCQPLPTTATLLICCLPFDLLIPVIMTLKTLDSSSSSSVFLSEILLSPQSFASTIESFSNQPVFSFLLVMLASVMNKSDSWRLPPQFFCLKFFYFSSHLPVLFDRYHSSHLFLISLRCSPFWSTKLIFDGYSHSSRYNGSNVTRIPSSIQTMTEIYW